jgi:dTDP-L-rhamnose 4-epimerase
LAASAAAGDRRGRRVAFGVVNADGEKRKALVTGGAGFIGSHAADLLLSRGWAVRALDDLVPQVHGAGRERPAYLDREVELIVGDVRDPAVVRRALAGCDAVLHLAARVGVGQSMYEIAEYVGANSGGTASLLEALTERRVDRLVVASSMSVYGEGLYRDARGRRTEDAERDRAALQRGEWDVHGLDGEPLTPLPTPESKRPCLSSVYALTKYDQERLSLMIGSAYGIPVSALRFFNVYGTRQSLSNPYTGVLAIFASRLLNGKPPLIFEDGRQRRDFVHVSDVARACVQALEAPSDVRGVFNIGSGSSCSVAEIAHRLASVLGRTIEPEISGKYRIGDIRNCFADITHARAVLGFAPRMEMTEGLTELSEWLRGAASDDRVREASDELATRGLTF